MLPGSRAQVWRHQPAYQRPRHFHEEPELNIVTHGRASFGIGGQVVTVRAGDALLFHPGQDHVLLTASADLGLFALALRPELAERCCGSLGDAKSYGCHLPEQERAQVTEALSVLSSLSAPKATEIVLSELFRSVKARCASTHVLSRLTLARVHAEPESLATALGTDLGADPSAISRHFHADLGLRFVDFRAHLRLIGFVRLVDSGHSLSRAALDAGFGSYAQCHRVFAASLGCSPREYFQGVRREVDERTIFPR